MGNAAHIDPGTATYGGNGSAAGSLGAQVN
jgi:hypothetical protein